MKLFNRVTFRAQVREMENYEGVYYLYFDGGEDEFNEKLRQFKVGEEVKIIVRKK